MGKDTLTGGSTAGSTGSYPQGRKAADRGREVEKVMTVAKHQQEEAAIIPKEFYHN
jgi:hypothetical protein